VVKKNKFWGTLEIYFENNNPMILDLISEYLNYKGGRNLSMNTMLCDMYDDLKIRSRQEI